MKKVKKVEKKVEKPTEKPADKEGKPAEKKVITIEKTHT